jgi:hypothetical protein
MIESLYTKRSNLIIGFHGCDQSVVDKVITGKEDLLASKNDYDWLGNGIYFWENNEDRALEWAVELSKRKSSSIKTPAVIGAIIDLGFCFDLTDNHYINELKVGYEEMVKLCHAAHLPIPQNKDIGMSTDLLLRKLDCAVIQTYIGFTDRKVTIHMILFVVYFGKVCVFIQMPGFVRKITFKYVSAIQTA